MRLLAALLLGFIAASAGFMGCSVDLEGSLTDADSLAARGNIDEAIESLKSVERAYVHDTTATLRIRSKMVDIYGGYAGDYSKAMALLAESVDRYPDRPETAANLFKLAFTCEALLRDMSKARQFYEMFLQKYPDHELATSVKVNLEHLGESEEEMLRRILEKASADSGKKGAR